MNKDFPANALVPRINQINCAISTAETNSNQANMLSFSESINL